MAKRSCVNEAVVLVVVAPFMIFVNEDTRINLRLQVSRSTSSVTVGDNKSI